MSQSGLEKRTGGRRGSRWLEPFTACWWLSTEVVYWQPVDDCPQKWCTDSLLMTVHRSGALTACWWLSTEVVYWQPVDDCPQKWCTDSCLVLRKPLAAVQLCHGSLCKETSHLKAGFAQQVEQHIRIKTWNQGCGFILNCSLSSILPENSHMPSKNFFN